MKTIYERTNLIITAFDAEDVITTSAQTPPGPEQVLSKRENAYGSFGSFDQSPGSWF